MHTHTKACSACAVSDAIEMVDAAAKRGYSGIVFTNHSYLGNTAVPRDLPWKDFIAKYRDDYLKAKEYAKKYDMDILFGMEELCYYDEERKTEVLIYGLSPEQYMEAQVFKRTNLKTIAEYVHERGGFISKPHPTRGITKKGIAYTGATVPGFDAIEYYNAGNDPRDNELAAEFFADYPIQYTSGSDAHAAGDICRGGLAFYTRIKDNAMLAKALHNKEYKLIIDGKIVD